MQSVRELMRREKERRQKEREAEAARKKALEQTLENSRLQGEAKNKVREALRRSAASPPVPLLGDYEEEEEEGEAREEETLPSIQSNAAERAASTAQREQYPQSDAKPGGNFLPADFFDEPKELEDIAALPEEEEEKTNGAKEKEAPSEEDTLQGIIELEVLEPDERLLLPLPQRSSDAAEDGGEEDEAANFKETENASFPRSEERTAVGENSSPSDGTRFASAGVDVSSDPKTVASVDTEGERDSRLSSFVLESVSLAHAVDETLWYSPYETALHSQVLEEEQKVREKEKRLEEAARRRREAAEAAAAAESRRKKQKLKDKDKKRGGVEAVKEQERSERTLDEELTSSGGKSELPWGFFDDFDGDARARGAIGPNELQKQKEELRAKQELLVSDLKEGRRLQRQEKEDIRVFLSNVEMLQQEQKRMEKQLAEVKQRARRKREEFVTSKMRKREEESAVSSNRLPGSLDGEVKVKLEKHPDSLPPDTNRRLVKAEVGEEKGVLSDASSYDSEQEDDFTWRQKILATLLERTSCADTPAALFDGEALRLSLPSCVKFRQHSRKVTLLPLITHSTHYVRNQTTTGFLRSKLASRRDRRGS